MRPLTRSLGAMLLLVLLALIGSTPAQADFGVTNFKSGFVDANGFPATQAGSHPFAIKTSFSFNTRIDPNQGVVPDGEVKAVRLQLPAGLAGNRTAVPRCTAADFLVVSGEGYPACPDNTAVGGVEVEIFNSGNFLAEPLYNLVPPPGVPAKLGLIAANTPITFEVGLNQNPPYNLTGLSLNTVQAVRVYGVGVEIWGNPAAPVHDPFRGLCLSHVGGVNLEAEFVSRGTCKADVEEVPLLTLPRSCTGPLTTSYEATSWQNPGAPPDKGSAQAPGMIGCAKLGLSPQVKVQPTTSSAESASGFDIDIDINDENFTSPTAEAQSDIKKAVVRMPAGMTLNPSAASGLAVCSRAGYEAESLTSQPGQGCPQASKVGEVEVESPQAEGEVLKGSVFLASQDDNPFGTLVALYMVIKDQGLGVLVKLAGKAEVSEEQGPGAGRIVTTFDDLPQVPLSHVHVHLNEGPRAPLVSPPGCGTYATEAEFTPWSEPSKPLTATATFKVTSGIGGGPCPAGGPLPFRPQLSAGTTNNSASSYSPFNLRLTRQDGEQNLTRLGAALPPGVSGKLAGIPECSDAAIQAARSRSARAELSTPSCPAASQIGHVLAGAGVGSSLTYVPGSIYLAGPFGGDPLSIVAIVPALAGPFDVGTVVNRLGLNVDPITAVPQVDSAHADPVPHLLKGIPVRLRDLRTPLDRSQFTFNATSCKEKSTKATLFGSFLDVFNPADDVPIAVSDRYQAADCANLGFKPKFALRLKGGTKRNDHPAFRSTVTYPYPSGPGYSNIAKAVVILPPSQFIDPVHINNPCTRVQFNANSCPKTSVLGTAKAVTPLLNKPLEGPVYFRSNGGERPLPDLVVDLKGQFEVLLIGQVDSVVNSKNARIRTTFSTTPDAPVTKFTLDLNGGKKKGLLVNSANLCAKAQRATVNLTGHNGKTYNTNPAIKTDCGKKKGNSRRR